MYIVVCTDDEAIDVSSLSGFGPFVSADEAEEWVDNSCSKRHWTIIKLNGDD